MGLLFCWRHSEFSYEITWPYSNVKKGGRWAEFLWPSQNVWILLVVLCCSWWCWVNELPWPLKVNFSPGLWNLIKKTPFQLEANTILIMKIALIFLFWFILVNVDRIGKINILQHNFSNKLSFRLKLSKNVNNKNWSTDFFQRFLTKKRLWMISFKVYLRSSNMSQKMYNVIFIIMASLWNSDDLMTNLLLLIGLRNVETWILQFTNFFYDVIAPDFTVYILEK